MNIKTGTLEGLGKGTYILILCLNRVSSLVVGKLGTFEFPRGWYAYCGSAYGPGGLKARLSHHLNKTRKPRWHIDYLRHFAMPTEAWIGTFNKKCEHFWPSFFVKKNGGKIIAPRFGSTDCQCVSHLVYFHSKPDMDRFKIPTTTEPGKSCTLTRVNFDVLEDCECG